MELSELLLLYLQENDLTLSFCSRKTGIHVTDLWRWTRGEKKMRQNNIEKIKEFLNGNFLISLSKILEGARK